MSYKECYFELVKQVNELEHENQRLREQIALLTYELEGFYREGG